MTAQYSVELAGHRADVRHVSLSGDNELLLSGARDGAKVWNVFSGACVRTLPATSVLSGCFVPGQRHVLLGTKSGELLLLSSRRSAACSRLRRTTARCGLLHCSRVRVAMC